MTLKEIQSLFTYIPVSFFSSHYKFIDLSFHYHWSLSHIRQNCQRHHFVWAHTGFSSSPNNVYSHCVRLFFPTSFLIMCKHRGMNTEISFVCQSLWGRQNDFGIIEMQFCAVVEIQQAWARLYVVSKETWSFLLGLTAADSPKDLRSF